MFPVSQAIMSKVRNQQRNLAVDSKIWSDDKSAPVDG